MGNACTELRGMYLQCLSHQVDIVVVTEISRGTSVLKHTRLNELSLGEMFTQTLSMDLSTQWPVLKFHDTTKAYHSMIVFVWNTWTTILMK